MPYTNKNFCWHGIVTTDPARALAFYTEVCGWQHLQVPMGDELADVVAAGGEPLAHVGAPQMEGVPSHWDNYLRVEDVDATARACAAAGGSIVVPGMDIPPGRFAVVTSPSGAMLNIFKEADPASTNHPGGDGSVHWTELHSTDVDADLAWLQEVFGFETSTMDMPDGVTYRVLLIEGQQAGGLMPQQHEGAPSMWLSWVQVDDADAAAARVGRSGGQLLSDMMDVPGVGRMVVAQDPTGGVFGLIKPANAG